MASLQCVSAVEAGPGEQGSRLTGNLESKTGCALSTGGSETASHGRVALGVEVFHAEEFEMPVGLWVFMACRAWWCPFYIELSP